jgi:hypothetical protein
VDLADALDDFGLRVATKPQPRHGASGTGGTYRDAKAILSRLKHCRTPGRPGAGALRHVEFCLGFLYHYMLGYCQAELGEFIDAVARGQDAVPGCPRRSNTTITPVR